MRLPVLRSFVPVGLAGVLVGLTGAPAMAQPAGYSPQDAPPGVSVDQGANDLQSAQPTPAAGQRASNIDSADTRSRTAPNLPSPDLGPDAPIADYLRTAQSALAGGRTGAAQQALEMAETRLLDRSVPLGQTQTPSEDPAIHQISQALRALAAGDRAGCMNLIQSTITSVADR